MIKFVNFCCFAAMLVLYCILLLNQLSSPLYYSLRERYGKLFALKLGQWKTVIVSDPESVKEVLVKKSGDFAGRPQFWSIAMCNKGNVFKTILRKCGAIIKRKH